MILLFCPQILINPSTKQLTFINNTIDHFQRKSKADSLILSENEFNLF